MAEPKEVNFMDFSKEELYEAWMAEVRAFQQLASYWIKAVAGRFGMETALELNDVVWVSPAKPVELNKVIEFEGSTPTPNMSIVEISTVKKTLKVHGDDVEALCKCLPYTAGTPGSLFYDIELKSKNHAICTIKRCTVLERIESASEELGGISPSYMCWKLETLGFAECARYINPKIKTIARKLPPRKNKDEIACQWEYILEE